MKSLTDIERHETEAILVEARRLCRAAPDLRDALCAMLRTFAIPLTVDQFDARRLARAAIDKSCEPIPAPSED